MRLRLRSLSVAVVAIVESSCGDRDSASALEGTWQSDKEGTVHYLSTESVMDPNTVSALTDIFGKLTLTYSQGTLSVENAEIVGVYPYEILSSESGSIAIETIDPKTELRSKATIVFEEGAEAFWLIPDEHRFDGFRERFTRNVD